MCPLFARSTSGVIRFYPPGTDRYESNPCPLGHICPAGSSQPIPCPLGSFGNRTHAETKGDCHPCPGGTFNHLPAQKACFPCGSSSTAPAGQMLLRSDVSFLTQITCLLQVSFVSPEKLCVTRVPSGSSSCTCIGKNRAFQPSDGSCLCRTGFIFYNKLDLKSSSSDSELDCQPEVGISCFHPIYLQ